MSPAKARFSLVTAEGMSERFKAQEELDPPLLALKKKGTQHRRRVSALQSST